MESALVVAGALAPILLAAATAVGPWRRSLGVLLLALAGACLFHGLTADGERMATVYHAFQGFTDSEPGKVDFPVETVSAPAGRWALILAGWTGLGGLLALVAGSRRAPGAPAFSGHPWLVPPLLALGGVAVNCLLEKAAAPTSLVYPFPMERVLLPATLAAGVLMAQRCDRFLPVFFQLTAYNFLVRGAVAYASYSLSTGEHGTSLDVHGVTDISNPMNQRFTDLEPHSLAQHGWLIWGPHLIVMPALTMMSMGSLTFCIFQFLKHPAAKR